jgi:hypothetical protein
MILTMMYGTWTCPSSGMKKLNTTIRKMDLFPSSGEGRKTPTLLGPLEGANLNHDLSLALSKGPNRVGVFPPSPENGSRSSFRNVVS